MNQERIEKIRRLLSDNFQPTYLEIIDDSHHHIGHAGASGGAGHFTIKICSSSFEGISLVKRHQKIYQVLASMMNNDIHALSIQALVDNKEF